jgi:hypothetical protein
MIFLREFRSIFELVPEREEFLEKHRISSEFDNGRQFKLFWWNLKSVGIRKTVVQSGRYIFATQISSALDICND